MKLSEFKETCNFLFGEYDDTYLELYNKDRNFKKYIHLCYIRKDDPDWKSLYRYNTFYFIPTFFYLENTSFIINKIDVLKFYSLSDTLFVSGTDPSTYLMKRLKTDEDFEVFLKQLTVPFTPKSAKTFDFVYKNEIIHRKSEY